jgi:hypothetical protein
MDDDTPQSTKKRKKEVAIQLPEELRPYVVHAGVGLHLMLTYGRNYPPTTMSFARVPNPRTMRLYFNEYEMGILDLMEKKFDSPRRWVIIAAILIALETLLGIKPEIYEITEGGDSSCAQ